MHYCSARQAYKPRHPRRRWRPHWQQKKSPTSGECDSKRSGTKCPASMVGGTLAPPVATTSTDRLTTCTLHKGQACMLYEMFFIVWRWRTYLALGVRPFCANLGKATGDRDPAAPLCGQPPCGATV